MGLTSTHAVSRVRRLFDAQKAGHAGTLDPLASGILRKLWLDLDDTHGPKETLMLPARFAHPLFALILSGVMSLIVSGLSTLRSHGLVDGFAVSWLEAWSLSWPVAFVLVLFLAPLVRKLVGRLVRPEA